MIYSSAVFTPVNFSSDLSKQMRHSVSYIITNFNYKATTVNEIVVNFAS